VRKLAQRSRRNCESILICPLEMDQLSMRVPRAVLALMCSPLRCAVPAERRRRPARLHAALRYLGDWGRPSYHALASPQSPPPCSRPSGGASSRPPTTAAAPATSSSARASSAASTSTSSRHQGRPAHSANRPLARRRKTALRREPTRPLVRPEGFQNSDSWPGMTRLPG